MKSVAREEAGQARAVRFKVPDGSVRVDDLVHGPIEFDASLIEDFVILRSDGHPTYHLSVVADDVEMGMTHVVRGDDHISNTPKQILLYQAIGAALPKFAHVPLILGADKKRLSKRHGATSVMEYASQGYLPEAMVNFLALLGWSPGAGDREVFARDELARHLRARRDQRRQRRLQSREARLVQPAAPRAARAGGAGAAAQAVVRRGRAVVGRSSDDAACVVFRRARAARAAGEAAAGFRVAGRVFLSRGCDVRRCGGREASAGRRRCAVASEGARRVRCDAAGVRRGVDRGGAAPRWPRRAGSRPGR